MFKRYLTRIRELKFRKLLATENAWWRYSFGTDIPLNSSLFVSFHEPSFYVVTMTSPWPIEPKLNRRPKQKQSETSPHVWTAGGSVTCPSTDQSSPACCLASRPIMASSIRRPEHQAPPEVVRSCCLLMRRQQRNKWSFLLSVLQRRWSKEIFQQVSPNLGCQWLVSTRITCLCVIVALASWRFRAPCLSGP